ncbi:MAG TPA: HDIG domain-containing protein [Prolixibacteraceae bacterium]|nr:HDIG domain-containing protein [Prolixibacteraceae bacterium]
MNQQIRKWIGPKLGHRLFLAGLFLITGIALYFSLPQEARFRYEYQKGRPWMHAALYAPYNFAIIKSEQEILHERDSLLKDQIPYFIYADSVSRNQVALLSKSIDQMNSPKTNSVPKVASLKLKLMTIYLEIYNVGILDQNFINNSNLSKKSSIKILKNNIGKEIEISSLYSLKSAYNEIRSKLDELKKLYPDWKSYLDNFQPEIYLAPNLIYDQERNRQTEEKMLENLSTNHGLVQEGERIISQGDIISSNTFSILESLRITFEKNRGENTKYILIVLGRVVLVTMLLLTLYLFLLNIRRKLMRSKRDITFILVTLGVMVASCSVVIRSGAFDIYVVPFTALALIIRTFLDTRVAIFVNMIAALLVGFMVPNGYEFVLLQITAGSMAVISLNKMQKREQLIITALIVFISYSVIYIGFSLVQEANLSSIEWLKIKWFGVNAILTLITYLLIYILEKSFGFVSDVTLIELTFSNQKLLKKLAMEAPGTMHHSLQVANLSEMAISRIGGNSLLVRAGALYHDIGKIYNPIYFIENQSAGINPHDNLSNRESAAIIIDHVERGVELAKKNKIPEQIIDFIRTHHGTTKTGYFYQKEMNSNSHEEINDQLFTYKGPLPATRETAVVMLADSIEAASRSLPVKNSETIRNLVDHIFRQKVELGQLEYAPLTFKDIRVLKELFHEKLINIYHVRVNYPEIKI